MADSLKMFFSGTLVGTGFGLALEKSKVYLPYAIQGQMGFTSFIMLKVFLSATATGLIVISLLERKGVACRTSKTSGLGFNLLGGYGGNIVGGLVLGAGISLSGACPGTVFAQFATGVPSALFVVGGTLVGALTFGYFHGLVTRFVKGFMASKPAPTLDKLVQVPFLPLSFAASALFASIVVGLEYVFPWTDEIPHVISNTTPPTLSLTSPIWHPAAAGILIGLMQIPSYFLAGCPLGASSSYMTFGSRLSGFFDPKNKERAPYYQGFKSPESLYQVGLMAGVLAISYLSAFLGKPEVIGQEMGVHVIGPGQAFLGGLLLIYGARIAGGCTSGHGISGIARLSLSSILTSAAMFAGGMAAMYFGLA